MSRLLRKRHLWYLAVGSVAACNFLTSAGAMTIEEQSRLAGGREVAVELPIELKRLLLGAKRLQKEGGLILDKAAIYEVIGVAPSSVRTSTSSDGAKSMSESLTFRSADTAADWDGELVYSQYPEIKSWSVRVDINYHTRRTCYPSLLVESFWGQQFAYRPLGSHALLREFVRRQHDLGPTSPHDGEPYRAEFAGEHNDSANVIFGIGRGSCLVSMTISKIFKNQEFGDDRIFRK